MREISYTERLEKLAHELVTPERFGEVAVKGFTTDQDRDLPPNPDILNATIRTLYPDIPQASIYYFPDRLGDSEI